MLFVVCDLAGRALGEPRAYERSLSVGISRPATAGFRIRADDPLWEQIAAGGAMLKVYDSADVLRFYGPIISDEEEASGQGSKVRANAADLSWRLSKRLIGKDVTAQPVGVTYTAQDSGTIAYNILAAANADEATGITVGTKDTFVARTITYLWKPALTAISELGAISGSYEWALRYTDGTPPTVQLDLPARLGQDRSATVFLEYGTGKRNCKGYRKVRSIEQLVTDIWVRGAGTNLIVNAFDAAARTAYRRHEDIVDYSDITVTALLDALAAAHIAIRNKPRELVELTPFAKNAPRYGVDWNVGDSVSARVMIRNNVRVNGTVRAWGADIAVDELGNEQPTLKLVPE